MNILLTDAEMRNLHSSYQHYVTSQQALNLTRQEETFYQETLYMFLTPNQSIQEGNPTFTLSITPAQWRSLRTAVIGDLAIYISIQASKMTAVYSAILEKLNTYELAAYVEEADMPATAPLRTTA